MKLLTVRELADICRVHESTVRTWIRDGAVPYVRIGGSIRFDPDVIAGLVKTGGGTQ